MKKILLTHAGAMVGAAAMVTGLLLTAAPEAESRSGTGNDRTGNTVSNQGMMVSSSMVSHTLPNDDIKPPVNSTAPTTNNTYDTTGVKARKEVKHGM